MIPQGPRQRAFGPVVLTPFAFCGYILTRQKTVFQAQSKDLGVNYMFWAVEVSYRREICGDYRLLWQISRSRQSGTD